ncbi:MAG: RNA polymerase factor sigma-32 [Alphaproteobacteria bacterium]|nr:RNA polymerase factor sigma-32 [Alphaproteobacteria bacterium]
MAHIDDPSTQKANRDYIRNSMNEPMLEKDHELELARLWREKGDEKALHELIRAYARLAVSMASKFRNYGLPMGDLIQEGNIGLMQAAARFEPERGIRFSTYASWWIRSAIQDYVLRNWSIVRTGTTTAQKSLFFNFRKLRAKIEQKSERAGLDHADRQKIARDLKVRVEDVYDMEGRLNGGDQSLNAKVGEGGVEEWQNFLPDESPTPEDIVIGMKDAQARSRWLNESLNKLTDREQKIIRDHHMGQEILTLEDIGKELGISKERVRQLEKRAMDKLRESITGFMGEESSLFAER